MGVDGPVIGPSPPQAVSVARLGALRWAELAVFALAGGWVTTTTEPEARVLLAGVSRHAARRAGVIGDRLPTAGALEASVVTLPPAPEFADIVGAIELLEGTADRLAALAEVVLPGIADAVASLVSSLSPIADATSLRTLPPLVDDLRLDASGLRECAAALGLAGTPGAAEAIAERIRAAGGW